MKPGLKKGMSNIEYLTMGLLKQNDRESMEFYSKKKNAAGKYEVAEIYNYGIIGTFLGVFNGSYDFGDENQKTFVLFMDIGKGKVAKIDMNQNYASRGFINSLCSVEDFNNMVSISTFLDKETGYSRLFVKEDGVVYPEGRKTAGWKYELDEIPKPIEHLVGKKTIKDLTPVEEWFMERVVELNKRIGKMESPSDYSNFPEEDENYTNSLDKPLIVDKEAEAAHENKYVQGFLSSIELAADPSSLLGVQDAVREKMSEFQDEELVDLIKAMQGRMSELHGNVELILTDDLPF